MAKSGRTKKMKKRDFPSNKKRAAQTAYVTKLNASQRLQAYGINKTNAEIGRESADLGTAGLVPNRAAKKMQAKKKLQTGRDIPLPKSKF